MGRALAHCANHRRPPLEPPPLEGDWLFEAYLDGRWWLFYADTQLSGQTRLRNVKVTEMFYNPDGTMKPVEELRAAFESAGVDLSRPLITTCGSGITAASLALALERLGKRDWSLYDGAWAEWGSYPDLKIATGDA